MSKSLPLHEKRPASKELHEWGDGRVQPWTVEYWGILMCCLSPSDHLSHHSVISWHRHTNCTFSRRQQNTLVLWSPTLKTLSYLIFLSESPSKKAHLHGGFDTNRIHTHLSGQAETNLSQTCPLLYSLLWVSTSDKHIPSPVLINNARSRNPSWPFPFMWKKPLQGAGRGVNGSVCADRLPVLYPPCTKV